VRIQAVGLESRKARGGKRCPLTLSGKLTTGAYLLLATKTEKLETGKACPGHIY